MVSIITPVYNAQLFLEECIDSVLKQSFDNWELIKGLDKSFADWNSKMADVEKCCE